MTDVEVEQKYHALCREALGRSRSDALLDALWTLERAPEIGPVLERVRIAGE
jgi:hypothetical protein